MKNIHVIPTDKPSFGKYLVINKKGKLCIWSTDTIGSQITLNPQHIYITSDEEIKEGDWCYDKVLNIVFKTDKHTNFAYINLTNNVLKIILTTDQDLDGVQAIDDEFLEWFVKNPSCEQVVVNLIQTEPLKGFIYNFEYKIIIPKEEPKQNKTCILCDGTGETTFSGTYNSQRKCDVCNGKGYIGLDIIKQAKDDLQLIKSLQETKQETLEEVAERILGNNINGLRDALKDDDLFFFYKGVIQSYGEAMAQYQAKRMYGEENVFQFFEKYREDFSIHRNIQVLDSQFKEWFEQFKKK